MTAGVANFTGCAITKAGTGYTLTASSNPAHTAPANANAFNITAGAASTIAVSSGSGQSATVGGAFTSPLVALVTDANGNPISGATVTFTPPGSGASATIGGGNTAVTNASGLATSGTLTANTTAGAYNVTAAATGTNTVNFSETNNPGTATKLTFTTQPTAGQNIQATGTGTFNVSVAVQDASGNTETGDNATTVTLAINNNPSGGVLTCTGGLGPQTVAAGVANFTGCAITKAGTGYTLTASSNPARTAPTNANAFNITAGTATALTFTTQPTSGQNIQATGTGTFNASVAVQDANGNTETGDNATTVTLAIGSNPSLGVLTCTGGLGPKTVTAGVANFTGCAITKTGTGYLLTATSGALTVPLNANAFNITAGTATALTFTTQPTSGQNIQATGTGTFNASVAVQDANGNTETGDNATTVTLAIGTNPSAGVLTCTGGLGPKTVTAGVANFTGCAITKTGTGYTLTASSNPAHTAPTNANAFNITAGTASTIAVSSGSGQSATVGAAFSSPLVALVTDANGNPVSGATVTFTPPGTGASATIGGGNTAVDQRQWPRHLGDPDGQHHSRRPVQHLCRGHRHQLGELLRDEQGCWNFLRPAEQHHSGGQCLQRHTDIDIWRHRGGCPRPYDRRSELEQCHCQLGKRRRSDLGQGDIHGNDRKRRCGDLVRTQLVGNKRIDRDHRHPQSQYQCPNCQCERVVRRGHHWCTRQDQ